MKRMLLSVVALLCATACTSVNEPAAQPFARQKGFDTPSDAARALIDAASSYDVPKLVEILGPSGRDLVASADTDGDRNRAAAFTEKAREKYAVAASPGDPSRAELLVGKEDWPLPIPIVESDGKWYFDTAAGRDEMLKRRIGSNELDAITVCRGFVDAEMEYSSQARDKSGLYQYAQKVVSSPGAHDGLAWQNADGSWGGPVGENVAKAIAQGWSKGEPYHGYYFKVLKGQGPAARLGQMDYMVGDAMIGGFALLAWPAEYGVTGVQTFQVSYDGVVYQRDLGKQTSTLAPAIERFNPDQNWKATNDDW